MDLLDNYLKGDYLDEKDDVRRLQNLGQDILPVFVNSYDPIGRAWPYELVLGKPRGKSTFSSSTNAMILFSLAVAIGKMKSSVLVPTVRLANLPESQTTKEIKSKLESIIPKGLDRLVKTSIKKKPGVLTYSPTFGDDDPFTLTWLLELLREYPEQAGRLTNPPSVTFLRKVKAVARRRIVRAFENPEQDLLLISNPKRDGTSVPHAFPLLRLVHLYSLLTQMGVARKLDTTAVRRFLLHRVHSHLSLSQIPDSPFDAAELVFSLEGHLILSKASPDLPAVDRVLRVLSERQEVNPYWRPLRPFKVTPQGLILLPQSVEIANSLLRICDSLDRGSGISRFSEHLTLFKRYCRWLESRVFKASDPSFTGWESEHTHAPNRIHLWQTSQALLFVQHYWAMLQQHVAQTSFRAARFVPTLLPSHSLSIDKRQEWKRDDDPLIRLARTSPYRVHERIEHDFVAPRKGSDDARVNESYASMLLYGPPGTGKSTIAEKLATALGFSMITITPSDFISAGQEGIEARAKAIFQTLEEQEQFVVLFDEIDQLLLDRGSALYRSQGDVFKLMTPGMLTKLNELSKQKRNVYVVATNYIERIDPAIKRPGRIDRMYLVLPPDREQRRRLLKRFKGWGAMVAGAQDEIVNRTALYTYRELDNVATRATQITRQARESDGKAALLKACKDLPATISLAPYRFRVNPKDLDAERPLEEFALLAYLWDEAGQPLGSENDWIRVGIDCALKERAVRDPVVEARLKKVASRQGSRR